MVEEMHVSINQSLANTLYKRACMCVHVRACAFMCEGPDQRCLQLEFSLLFYKDQRMTNID